MNDDQSNGCFEMPIEFGFVFIGAGIAVGISIIVVFSKTFEHVNCQFGGDADTHFFNLLPTLQIQLNFGKS